MEHDVAEAEDAPVRRHQPVATPAGSSSHTDDRRDELARRRPALCCRVPKGGNRAGAGLCPAGLLPKASADTGATATTSTTAIARRNLSMHAMATTPEYVPLLKLLSHRQPAQTQRL